MLSTYNSSKIRDFYEYPNFIEFLALFAKKPEKMGNMHWIAKIVQN